MLTAEQLSKHPFLTRLGPDVLDPALSWQEVAARLQAPRFHGRQLGSLYLDQGFVAGTGNYLRSEILFLSGLHPSRKPRDLSRVQRNRLARQTLATARRSGLAGRELIVRYAHTDVLTPNGTAGRTDEDMLEEIKRQLEYIFNVKPEGPPLVAALQTGLFFEDTFGFEAWGGRWPEFDGTVFGPCRTCIPAVNGFSGKPVSTRTT